MENKIHRTLVKYDHEKFGRNSYVCGRIAGYLEIICGISSPWKQIPNIGEVIECNCEPEKYDHFKTMVEDHYPDLCKFDY